MLAPRRQIEALDLPAGRRQHDERSSIVGDRELRRGLNVQRIDFKNTRFQLITPLIDQLENTRLFHAVVGFRIFFEITPGHPHELVGGAQTRASGGPFGIFVHRQVHKTARQLNERLIKVRIGLPARLQP